MTHTTGVIILNYNNDVDTIACIDSLCHTTNDNSYKIIVVDNASNSECRANVDKYIAGYDSHLLLNDGDTVPTSLPFITHLHLDQNCGYARGNNRGLDLAYADSEIDRVMILNNDILLTENIITPLNNDLDTIADVAIVTPLLYKRDGVSIDHTCARKAATLGQILGLWAVLHRTTFGIMHRIYQSQFLLPTSSPDEPLLRVELPSGSCMMCDKELFRKIGSFDPNTFLYYEENIIWEKIKALGLSNYLDKRISCIHLGAATTSTKSPSAFIAKCSVESTRYFIRNYTNAGLLYRWALEIFFALFRLKIGIKSLLK